MKIMKPITFESVKVNDVISKDVWPLEPFHVDTKISDVISNQHHIVLSSWPPKSDGGRGPVLKPEQFNDEKFYRTIDLIKKRFDKKEANHD